MSLVSVKFRGGELDVEFRHYIEEPEVNFYGVDWDFHKSEIPNPEANDEELADIERQLWEKRIGRY